MPGYRDLYFAAPDGLRLHARDYGDASAPTPPVLCLGGLTRNARDFADLAERLAPTHRVIVAEQRGRGLSAYDSDPAKYQPGTYVTDMVALLDHLGLDKVTIIGTSLGGMMAMMLAVGLPGRIAGILINDVGAEINQTGIDKIQTYIDRVPQVANWEDAARDAELVFGGAFPKFIPEDWMKMARAIYVEDGAGVPKLDFDPGIAVNVKSAAKVTAPDLWPVFDALPKIPTAVLRGGLSDLLSAETLEKMAARRPDLMTAEVPDVGHAPRLDEPESIALVDRFLAAIPGR